MLHQRHGSAQARVILSGSMEKHAAHLADHIIMEQRSATNRREISSPISHIPLLAASPRRQQIVIFKGRRSIPRKPDLPSRFLRHRASPVKNDSTSTDGPSGSMGKETRRKYTHSAAATSGRVRSNPPRLPPAVHRSERLLLRHWADQTARIPSIPAIGAACRGN